MAQLYRNELGSDLKDPNPVHRQVFQSPEDVIRCESHIKQLFPDMTPIYDDSVNHDYRSMQNC